MIDLISTGLIYSNPSLHLTSRQAFHPSLVSHGDSELTCSFDLGEAVESLDYRTYLSRSTDDGDTWHLEGPVFEDTSKRASTHTIRTSLVSGGAMVGFGARFYRDDPEEGLTNRGTFGFVPMDLFLLRSDDKGKTWVGPEELLPPLVGPAFEMCHSILELPEGRWLAPTATWRGWDGEKPSGEKAIVLISEDLGQAWPEYGVSFDAEEDGVVHWEQSITPLADGRLLAISWVHDTNTGQNLLTPYSFSEDGGKTFSAPRPTGLHGQTSKAIQLSDERILCIYRRDDRPGLWANLSGIDGTKWSNESELPLWGAGLSDSGMTGAGGSSEELSALKFGYPSPIQTSPGEVLVAFWCLEGWSCNIRWIRLRVN
jgi:hypothetical protein